MRDDQYQRLHMLHEKWVDILCDELDEDLAGTKDGAMKPSNMLTQAERGNRYWQKKNMAASLTLANKIQTTLERPFKGLPTLTPPEDEDGADDGSDVDIIDKEIDQHENHALRLLNEFHKQRNEQDLQ